MAAEIGNQYAKKLNTPELCEIAYKSYCAHLSLGKDKRSWCLEEPVTLTWETMEKYIRENPEVFDPLKKRIAEAKGYRLWEEAVEGAALGRNKDHNTATLQMKMRNKFGWDKVDRRDEDESGSTEHNFERIMIQLRSHQRSKTEKD